MNPALRGRLVVPVILGSLILGLAACGGEDADKKKLSELAKTACSSDITQKAATQPPNDVPTPSGVTAAYEYIAQGATKVWYFAIDGAPADLSSLRDSYDKSLTSAGYTIKRTDQEENAEAESEFSGAHDGTTNFRPLCDGKDILRLKLTS